MVTKEQKLKKYCCFYVSDFHLEMILLPYIKNNIDKNKFVIFTEKNLLESMKILLDRTNLNWDEKKNILSLNWDNRKKEDIYKNNFNDYTIIINGTSNYISKMNEEIKKMEYQKINIIDCYNINEKNLDWAQIQEKYDETLNTRNVQP